VKELQSTHGKQEQSKEEKQQRYAQLDEEYYGKGIRFSLVAASGLTSRVIELLKCFIYMESQQSSFLEATSLDRDNHSHLCLFHYFRFREGRQECGLPGIAKKTTFGELDGRSAISNESFDQESV
jgi:hypothetical protein